MSASLSPRERVAARSDSDVWLVLAAGVAYFGLVFLREPIAAHVMGVRLPPTGAYLREHGVRYFLADFLVRAPALCMALGVTLASKTGSLREALRSHAHGSWTWKAAILTVVLSLLLNTTGLWPFSWRWATSSTGPTARVLLQAGQLGSLVLWTVVSVAVIPLTEECIFRFGLLRALSAATRSNAAGVVLTAAIFAIGHLGYLPSGHLDAQHASAAVWAFAMSLILGWITVSRGGEIKTAAVVHATRNALELAVLLLVVDIR